MLLKLKKGNYDFVFNSRYMSRAGSCDDTLLTKIGNFFLLKFVIFFFPYVLVMYYLIM